MQNACDEILAGILILKALSSSVSGRKVICSDNTRAKSPLPANSNGIHLTGVWPPSLAFSEVRADVLKKKICLMLRHGL